MAKKKDLKTIVEDGITAVLEDQSEPSDGRLKALALGIKMCALNSRLQESEYGDFFSEPNPDDILNEEAETKGIRGGVPSKKPRKDKRAEETIPPEES